MFIKRKKKTENDREQELMREREKQRKKMIRTRYGQKQKKHAKKGVQSCVLTAIAVIFLVLMIFGSFVSKGDVGLFTGIVAVVTLILAIRAFTFAMRGFKERDKNYITCKVSAAVSGVLVLCMCAIFIRGLF